jgi:hypothetical protein
MPVALSSLLIACIALSGTQVCAQQGSPELWVSAVRFYRPEKRQTMVKVLVQMPYTGTGYTMAVRVTDSTGQVVQQQSWVKPTGKESRAGRCAVELLDFPLAPGKHRLEVSVSDTGSGTRAEAGVDLYGFGEPPPASDLMLAPRMRAATSEDTVPHPGELRRGNILISATAHPTITSQRSQVYYLLEVYSVRPDSGTIVVEVVDSSGEAVGRTAPAPVRVEAGGAVLRSQIDLGGLSPGRYELAVDLELDQWPVRRSAAFSVLGGDSAAVTSACEIRY